MALKSFILFICSVTIDVKHFYTKKWIKVYNIELLKNKLYEGTWFTINIVNENNEKCNRYLPHELKTRLNVILTYRNVNSIYLYLELPNTIKNILTIYSFPFLSWSFNFSFQSTWDW